MNAETKTKRLLIGAAVTPFLVATAALLVAEWLPLVVILLPVLFFYCLMFVGFAFNRWL